MKKLMKGKWTRQDKIALLAVMVSVITFLLKDARLWE